MKKNIDKVFETLAANEKNGKGVSTQDLAESLVMD
ncbi:hypothetical protein M2475_000729 [Breznakia sp. PF5-3]|nr:hypothetical protein [Breznakia sp. PM6-1]MDF9835168.1 hypothetical protein [Breznakia sp. PF5-3]MDF9838307.1 hypothetical protein [Breznakia sp. PFB2-8]MDF9860323.1 hypothetical protein [Breznakia sp. PH5-24]